MRADNCYSSAVYQENLIFHIASNRVSVNIKLTTTEILKAAMCIRAEGHLRTNGMLFMIHGYRSVRLPVDIEFKALDDSNNNVYFKNNTRQLLKLGISDKTYPIDNLSHWSPKTRNHGHPRAENKFEFSTDEYHPDTTSKSKF